MEQSSILKRAGNRALDVNPPNADINLGRWGSDWGWTVFCLMAASTLGLLIWSTMVARSRRAIHYLLTAVLAISTVSWYSLASGLGSTPITVQFLRNSPLGGGYGGYPTRQIYYARYIDWTLTTTLLLLSLLLLTGLPLSVIFITLFFNILMIVCGLLGALTRSRYKWGYFVSRLWGGSLRTIRSDNRADHRFILVRRRSLLALPSATWCTMSLLPACARLDDSEMALAKPSSPVQLCSPSSGPCMQFAGR